MDAVALYKAGQLQPAIEALGTELRKQPTDTKRRTFLFELLCFAGEYDRAAKQLDVLADTSKDAGSGAMLYRSALHAQRTREEMFLNGTLPLLTEEEGPAGELNGEPFSTIQDDDPRLGGNLEVFIAGSYTWIPFRYVESVTIEPPSRLRDLLWIPALLQTTKDFRLQDLGQVLLPALAPLSWRSSEDDVRLGRASVLEENGAGEMVPLGAKILFADDRQCPLLEVRSLRFSGREADGEI